MLSAPPIANLRLNTFFKARRAGSGICKKGANTMAKKPFFLHNEYTESNFLFKIFEKYPQILLQKPLKNEGTHTFALKN